MKSEKQEKGSGQGILDRINTIFFGKRQETEGAVPPGTPSPPSEIFPIPSFLLPFPAFLLFPFSFYPFPSEAGQYLSANGQSGCSGVYWPALRSRSA